MNHCSSAVHIHWIHYLFIKSIKFQFYQPDIANNTLAARYHQLENLQYQNVPARCYELENYKLEN